jgi:hypothetical protein
MNADRCLAKARSEIGRAKVEYRLAYCKRVFTRAMRRAGRIEIAAELADLEAAHEN